jgi:hypothetical protein
MRKDEDAIKEGYHAIVREKKAHTYRNVQTGEKDWIYLDGRDAHNDPVLKTPPHSGGG